LFTQGHKDVPAVVKINKKQDIDVRNGSRQGIPKIQRIERCQVNSASH
jgi:hypothetical protein